MSLSKQEIALVQASLAMVDQEYDPSSTFFYDRLFSHNPGLKDLFRDDLAGQGMKFMSTLTVIVEALNDPEALRDELAPLGEGHAAIGVRPAHFAPMAEALIDTFQDVLGDHFTPELDTAWRAAFAEIGRQMIEIGPIE